MHACNHAHCSTLSSAEHILPPSPLSLPPHHLVCQPQHPEQKQPQQQQQQVEQKPLVRHPFDLLPSFPPPPLPTPASASSEPHTDQEPLPVVVPRKPKTPRSATSSETHQRTPSTRYSYSFMADLDSLDTTVFDAIVLGTGFTQSIVAAALARAGKAVLHLDENDYYGGESGAFGLKELLVWAQRMAKVDQDVKVEDSDKIDFDKLVGKSYDAIEFDLFDSSSASPLEINLASVLATNSSESVENQTAALESHLETEYRAKTTAGTGELDKSVKEAIQLLASLAVTLRGGKDNNNNKSRNHCNIASKVSIGQIQTLAQLCQQSRRYNFDLSPKLLYSRGPLTNLLISSGIGKYLEFKLLERTAVYEVSTDKVEMLPTSKEDVFVSKALSLKEKRLLMKFLQFAVDYENQREVWADYEHATFTRFVQAVFGLQGKILTAVVYAIGFDGHDYATTAEGLKSVKVYLQSLGRYGNSAYLCPLYGVGSELAQAFCRVSAVYGGIYMLQHGLERHVVDKTTNEWKSLVDKKGTTLQASQLICSREYLSGAMDGYIEARTLNRSYVSHCILVTDRSAFGETTLCKTLFPKGSLVLNPEAPASEQRKNEHTISVLQMCGGTMSCPNDRFVLYVWAEADEKEGTAKEELLAAIRNLVHIPGDKFSLPKPTQEQSSSSSSESAAPQPPSQQQQQQQSTTTTTATASTEAPDQDLQPRMSLDQEIDMEQVKQEILAAEKKLFEESASSSETPSRPSTPAPSGSKPATTTSPLLRSASKSSSSSTTTTWPSPQALMALYYKRTSSWPRVPYPEGSENLTPLPKNLTVVQPLTHSLDFEEATEEARAIFERLCPDFEFLPPTPDPED